jgi:broad specificity phosphatase PhoE
MTPLQIYFIRHGETAWSLTGQHTGRTDLPLTPHGETMAAQLATTLTGASFSMVLTNPRAACARHLPVGRPGCQRPTRAGSG